MSVSYPDILLDIISIYEDYSPVSCATLAALARTCRIFKEPALDTLWKDINGFKPLLSCLPESVVYTFGLRGMLMLTRPLLNAEWRIIAQYAQRIRSFRVSPTELEIIDDCVVQALISAPSPLLPDLRSLVWLSGEESFFPLLHTLLRSTITSVQLDFSSSFSNPSFAKSALLASIGARCLSIQELDCVYDGDSEESSDAICEALCGLRELSHLGTGALNAQALLRLASLPLLKSLHFSLRSYDINETQSNPTPTHFSQLDQVHITTPTPSVFNHCLRNIRFLSCRTINLRVEYNDLDMDPYDPLDIPDFIVSISECFSPALEKLHFDFNLSFSTLLDRDILANPSFALGFDAIAPMLWFNCLTDLQLDWMCTSAIDDASLKTMARSWPQLENFSFGSAARWLVPPSLTFIGLVHLIHHCRRLHSIEMPFCACPVDTNSEPFSKTIPNEKITRLFVGISPIVDPTAVACQLHIMLPKLTTVGLFDWLDAETPVPPPFEEFEDRWSKVNEFLGVITIIAKMREEMGQAPQEPILPG
ncbi:uncharacterized protein EDB91DRAFT_601541 [Suillus paluster]|uniref:uncharacterized protein n=1 Tax=Suillus paluster TaxID=48578 RepID=UPI001B864479|nr:uncharacterized protein EDB91DRAFT_601541 [Suillus paluster]KAG1751340.1 hypothetical protein EDB91DRAFT_601541 [Suillus paluster]